MSTRVKRDKELTRLLIFNGCLALVFAVGSITSYVTYAHFGVTDLLLQTAGVVCGIAFVVSVVIEVLLLREKSKAKQL